MSQPLQVLSALDHAKTQFYHFTAIIIAGMGFFTDAYDLFSISLITRLLGRLYYTPLNPTKPGRLPINVNAAVTGVALCGTLLGNLFFGWLGDRMGRKKVYGVTLQIMFFTSICSGISFGSTPKAVMTTLCFFRFWVGFGVGGDYPLSATIMSEYANKRTRGAFIAAVFAMQGIGILASGVVGIIISAVFERIYSPPTFAENAALSRTPEADYMWRVILMAGAIPAGLTYYWRMRMPETARYTALVARNAKQAAEDMSKVLNVQLSPEQERLEKMVQDWNQSFGLFSMEFLRVYGLRLLGTTSTWFLLDIAFYSQNLFQKDLFTSIGWIPSGSNMSAIGEVFKISRAQTLIALCGTVPGYWFSVVFIDIIGRIRIQLIGFFFMTVFMLTIGIMYDYWEQKTHRIGFLVMYSFTFFFANFGPNTTTFVIPAEIFPARLRSTCHGISAAAGKAGAIVGSFGFLYLSQDDDEDHPIGIGKKKSLIVLGVINFVGMLFTFLLPESNGLNDSHGQWELRILSNSLRAAYRKGEFASQPQPRCNRCSSKQTNKRSNSLD